ncbi:hypothetical protein ARALYDRAFT_314017 [Arabidopsis lyrata subsp. lyrata]|uniref:Uncharacterized protein n=1 Tax=Arabidopsis lyrata subsp. lyrata TaxID=81972 RepID=D7KL76_ARALL|nr:hypothetical protein ARALYDRAFT_314017 [Arabidopsis lyrata subsp. lyrata]
MESMSMTDRVVRNNKRLPQTDLNKEKEKQKEETIRLGVELSLFVAEAMFILSDDLRSTFEYYIQELKKLEEKLRSAKEFSEANGFVREEIKSNIVHLWKSLFEATPEVINPNKPILLELFRPIENEVCCRRLASLLI